MLGLSAKSGVITAFYLNFHSAHTVMRRIVLELTDLGVIKAIISMKPVKIYFSGTTAIDLLLTNITNQ